jgi:hypothetical protein
MNGLGRICGSSIPLDGRSFGEAGDEQHRQVRPAHADDVRHLAAVLARHGEIDDHQLELGGRSSMSSAAPPLPASSTRLRGGHRADRARRGGPFRRRQLRAGGRRRRPLRPGFQGVQRMRCASLAAAGRLDEARAGC